MLAEPTGESGRQLRVHQESHCSSSNQDWVIHISRCVGDAGADVLRLEVWEIGKNFFLGGPTGKHVQDILHADAHATYTRAPAALIWVNGDAFQFIHAGSLADCSHSAKAHVLAK